MTEPPFWREQYSHLISITDAESNRFWKRFEVYLAVNSGLIAVLSYLFNVGIVKNENYVLIVSGILGIALSFMWLLTIHASRILITHYAEMGRKIEKDDKHVGEMNGVKIFEKYDRKITVTNISFYVPIIFIIIWSVFIFLSSRYTICKVS